MQTLETLKRKIDTAQDLQSVVKTMKSLAAVSIRQYESAVDSLSEYYRTIELGIRIVLWQRGALFQPMPPGSETRTGVVVFGSDQGMCGQFNEQIATHAVEDTRTGAPSGNQSYFITVGVRLLGRLEEAGATIDDNFENPSGITGITPMVQQLLARLERWYAERQLVRILLYYNRHLTGASYRPTRRQLLPIEVEKFLELKETTWPSRTLPTFTMNPDRLFSALMRQYLFVSLYRASAESLASENASRIASMQAAERNIDERLNELRTEFNHQRQTSITEELLDVVTGFEALSQKDKRAK